MRVDEAFVISLPERTDRLRHFRLSLPPDWPLPAVRLHPGVKESAPPWWHSSDGAWGCRQAHLNLLQSAWDRGVQATLVMEDDAVFAREFTERWNRITWPRRTDMVMLGGQHMQPPSSTITPGVVRCLNTRRTHAYIIQLKAIPLLMRTWSQARRHIDHAFVDFQKQAAVYAPEQFLIGQNAGYSDISRKDNPRVRFWA